MAKKKKVKKHVQAEGQRVRPPVLKGVLVLGGIFILALTLRSFHLHQYSQSPHWDLLTLDPNVHDLLAREIAEKNFMGNHPFFRAPVYPYLLGFVYTLFGPGLLIPRLINILCGALSCVLIYLIGARIFRPAVGTVAGLIACVYWVFIYFEGELLLVAVYVFLLLFSLHMLLKSDGHRRKQLALSGLLLGLATLTRPNVLVFYPLVLIWFWLKRPGLGRELLVRSLCFFVPALVLVFSVTLRNYVVGGDRVLIAYQAGVNFWIGNNADSNGHAAQSPYSVTQIPPFYKEKHKDNIWINDDVWLSGYYLAEQNERRNLKPSEMQNYWFGKAFHYIRNHPGDYAKLLLKKVYFFFNAYEIPNNKNLYLFIRDHAPLLDFLAYLDFGVIVSLALLGIVVSLAHWRAYFLLYAFLASYSLTNIAFFINTRFRVPTLPCFILFAAFFLFWLWERIRAKHWLRAAASAAACGVLVVLTHTAWFDLKDPRLESVLHYNLGLAFGRKGDLDSAATEFKESVRLHPDVFKPYENLCIGYVKQGDLDEAVRWALKGLDRFPEEPKLRLCLGTAYLQKGAYGEAALELERVIELDPGNSDASVNLGITYYEAGEWDKATQHLERTLTMITRNPMVHVLAHLHLGFIALEEKRYEEARRSFEEVLTLDPFHVDALFNLARTLLNLGETYSVRSILERVLQAEPTHTEARELLESLKP